ncbi:PAS domain-containing sensor histidine kinase [Spongiivirga citrea]|uniref:histidine kinase n=1 Tax=Spongiivirga citrea TaxID=1481457 RepID=A0A6M0CM34_9FLAO|nr:PAS domain-containing protein [Spongiivirga citrea]NER18996.1 PAS domain-containing protein [Spongiivirga citrea]
MSLAIKDTRGPFVEGQSAMQKAFKDVGGLIFQFQYFPDKKHSCFPFASAGLISILDLTPDQIKQDATPVFERLHPDDEKTFYKVIKKSMETLESWDYDYRVVLPRQGLKWLRGHGRPEKLSDGSYLWNGCMMDITDRKLIEVDLYESKQRLQLAMESTKDGLWDWNVKTDKVFYSNESKALLGYQPDELKNTSDDWNSKVHPEDRASYYDDMHNHFDGKTPYYFNEHRILCKDGHYKWILDRGKVIEWDSSGNPLRVIGTHSDISLQKQRELEARTKIDIIEDQNNRLTNFAHIVSHNLRSHSGNFEMLLDLVDEADSSEEKLEMVNHLKKVSESLSETIAHLNKVVSIQTNLNKGLEKISLSNCIVNTVSVLKGEIDKKNAIITNKVSSEIFVDHNPAYLESILLNLISNGLKYKHADRNPEIILETIYENGKLSLKVSDNGIGIDLKKHGKNLFGMYKTFHGNNDAKGIGLFITKNQIESLGGTIAVESEVNVGTSFKITFN